jgi:hypothetical protein
VLARRAALRPLAHVAKLDPGQAIAPAAAREPDTPAMIVQRHGGASSMRAPRLHRIFGRRLRKSTK